MAMIQCRMCGAMISQHAMACPKCGAPGVSANSSHQSSEVPAYQQQTSAQGFHRPRPNAVPDSVGKWNWGAFTFGWLWGVCNGVYWPLITLIPYVGWIANIIIIFILGAKGNELAYKSSRWKANSPEAFDRAQKGWNRAAGVVWLIAAFIVIITLVVITIED